MSMSTESTVGGVLREKASDIKEFWFDVDGVLVREGYVYTCALQEDKSFDGLIFNDGVKSVLLRPFDGEEGMPIPDAMHIIAQHDGEPTMEVYRFSIADGIAIERLIGNGFPVRFVSGRNSPCVRARAQALNVTPFLGEKDKLTIISAHTTFGLESVLFVGDGPQDCPTLRAVGIGIAPADASPEAKAAAHAVTLKAGGEGVIYEIAKEFLTIRGLWSA